MSSCSCQDLGKPWRRLAGLKVVMSHKAALKPYKHSSTSWDTWILVSAITIMVAVIVVIELHIRHLTAH